MKMKHLIVLSFIVLSGVTFFPASSAPMQDINYSQSKVKMPADQLSSETVVKRNPDFGTIPLYFIPNKGQVNEKARFYAKTSHYTLWMTKKGLVFDSVRSTRTIEEVNKETSNNHSKLINRDVSWLVFLDANKNPEMVPIEKTSYKVNYLNGNDRSMWLTDIQTSKAVLYKNVYKNIDLKVYGIEKQIEYDWILKPRGDPQNIRIQYRNVKGTHIDDRGNLLIETQLGKLIHKRPVGYQEICLEPKGERRIAVNVEFKKIGENTYGFEVGAYDKSKELIIDPVVMAYSTFFGGSGDDYAYALAVDSSGSAYVTGEVHSTDFPVDDAYQNSFGGGDYDAFVTKFSASGSTLVYSAYLGGTDNESGEGIQVDSFGKAYITGYTHSTNFPTQSAYQNTHGGGDKDAFVTVVSASGSSLNYSTYLGGNNDDIGYALALGSSGNIYVTGKTESTNFPTQNAYTASYRGGGDDTFVTKFSASGSSLVYSTYLGGNGIDGGYGIVESSGNAYVVGRTASSNFPMKNAFQNTHGGGDYDAFVTKFSSSGSSLIYSTYLGGNLSDAAWGIAVDSSGSAHAVGDTYSSNFPIQNAYQSTHAGGGKDAFITKFSNTGTSLEFSTFLGGIEEDAAAHVVLNNSGNAYVIGATQSSDFPVKRAYQSAYNGNYDVFVSMLSATGSSLNFSTFLGGSDEETGRAIALDSTGNIYIAGFTESSDFPIKNGYQNTLKGDLDAFVAKLSTSEFGTLCGSVDNCNLTWTTGGNADWFEQTDTTYYDEDAAQSGDIGDSEATYIQTTVTGPGTLSFWWKVSSSYSDYLRFYIDGEVQTSISGTYTYSNWHQKTYNISPGTHALKWSYEKNAYYSYGSDCGWLDKVEYTPETTIVLNRTQLTFGAVQGNSTGSQTFSISSNAGALNWSVSANKSWIIYSPTSGTGSGTVTVSVNATGLSKGSHTGTISISDPNATNSPQTVSIILNVYNSGTTSVPFGDYATPTNNSTIRSSVPFTGWVLDDLGVVSVKLYRHYHGALVYIGDGVFVEGARPDVEQAYPDYPYNYKAGWGYMMLTNFLPNSGNGTFIIDAIATDVEGHQVTLGSKTVFVDNANAVKPFGAIDTPTQGGTASGSNFRNQGWVLTPLPNAIPTDGSTIDVFVDGVNLGHPIYNLYRSDIATLFPGYANSNGAFAYFDFDTTTYTNGVHTIHWVASDDAGNIDGIGSRYFSIQNSGTSSLVKGQRPMVSRKHTFSKIPVENSLPVEVIKGFDRNVIPLKSYPNEKGFITVEITELERFEIQLFPRGTAGFGSLYNGYQVIGNRLTSLPIGSTLDIQRGIFCWYPGPGFVGEYWLVFLVNDPYGNMISRNISVNIIPKF